MTWGERAGKLFCYLCIGALAYIAIKFALGIFLPFIIAWGLAILTSSLSRKLSKKLGLSRKFCSFVLTFLILGLIFGGLFFGVNRLIYEVEKLLARLSENGDTIGSAVGEFLDRISSLGDKKLPIIESLLKNEQFREFWGNIDSTISNMLSNALISVTSQIPRALLSFFKSLPSVLVFLMITVISCFYFAADIDNINRTAVSLLPKKLQLKVPTFKKRFLQKSSRYLRAYLILLFLTFAELLIGLSVLRTPYPLLLAILISILDILPILGVGTALIPWAIIEILFLKDYYTGVGLLIVYVIITIVRQVTEPKIVAGSLGLSPLLTLVSMYAGLKLFGFLGVVIGPMLVIILRSVKDFSQAPKGN